MQPAAHYSAAIEILEPILTGTPAEKALLSWARSSRFAGSKDRAVIRDIVFDTLRKRSSYAARFGMNARGLVLGRAREEGDLALFTGLDFAPAPLSEIEQNAANSEPSYASLAEEYDFPPFLEDALLAQYGELLPALMDSLRQRAPVDLRVNSIKATPEQASDFLARDHIFVENLEEAGALRIVLNPRRLSQSRAFNYGFVELQDVSSQIVARFANAKPGQKVLDYCAGGGGKALALAMSMKGKGRIDAWDISSARMKEIPSRAGRAGVNINVLSSHPTQTYDLVFVDAPCSGTGAWRRTPDAKWRLTQTRIDELNQLQGEILLQAARHVKAGGELLYATCSILESENQQKVQNFLSHAQEFQIKDEIRLNPLNAGDGFYAAKLIKN